MLSPTIATCLSRIADLERRHQEAAGDDSSNAIGREMERAVLLLAREPALTAQDAAAKLHVLTSRLRRDLPPEDGWQVTSYLLAESALAALTVPRGPVAV